MFDIVRPRHLFDESAAVDPEAGAGFRRVKVVALNVHVAETVLEHRQKVFQR